MGKLAEELKKTDDSDLECAESDVYKKYSRLRRGTDYEIYLDHSVDGYSLEATKLFHDLRSFTSDDTVTIYLDNNGGDADMGLRVARAIKQCRATTVIQLEANSYSAGAVIALSGDLLRMQPGTFLMFHNYSIMNHGKGGEYRTHNDEWDKSFWKQAIDIICPFLTLKEIHQLRDDRDIYVVAPSATAYTKEDRAENKRLHEELLVRYKRHFPHLKELTSE